jgi:hypothetical protein
MVHDEIDHVNGSATQLAPAGEAMHRVGLRVHLHARGLVVVERAAEHFAWVGFQPVMVEQLKDGELGFDVGYLHGKYF